MTAPVMVIAEMAATEVEVQTLSSRIENMLPLNPLEEEGDDYFGLS